MNGKKINKDISFRVKSPKGKVMRLMKSAPLLCIE